MRLIKTDQDEETRRDVKVLVERIDELLKHQLVLIESRHGDKFHIQRHLAVLSSALITCVNHTIADMYCAVGIERTAADKTRFHDKLNQVMIDESLSLKGKFDGTSN